MSVLESIPIELHRLPCLNPLTIPSWTMRTLRSSNLPKYCVLVATASGQSSQKEDAMTETAIETLTIGLAIFLIVTTLVGAIARL